MVRYLIDDNHKSPTFKPLTEIDKSDHPIHPKIAKVRNVHNKAVELIGIISKDRGG